MAVEEMLVGYQSTLHPATGVSPYKALMKRQVRTKLGYTRRSNTCSDKQTIDNQLMKETSVIKTGSRIKLKTEIQRNMTFILVIMFYWSRIK